jgi:hypothetical protein
MADPVGDLVDDDVAARGLGGLPGDGEEPPAGRTLVVRVWLPDRPGALGEVATNLGRIGADVVGIEILEQGAGTAVDELVVRLPASVHTDELVAAVRAAVGAEVEDLHAGDTTTLEPDLGTLELAAVDAIGELIERLLTHVSRSLRATWSVVVDLEGHELIGAHGDPPVAKWLVAFLHGSATSAAVADGTAAPPDMAWALLPSGGLALMAGRDGIPIRQRERRRLAALIAIADARLAQLA